MNLECEYIQGLLHEYFDGELDYELNGRIKKHLEHCKDCQDVYNQITHLSSIIKRAFSYTQNSAVNPF